MHEIIFKNGPSARPYVEITELFIEKENKHLWAVTVGLDFVLVFDKQNQKYDVMAERLAFTNQNPVWTPRLTGYWINKEQAKDALVAALKQDANLFFLAFLFWDGNTSSAFNTKQRELLLTQA